MLGKQLGHHLILALQFGFQFFDLLRISRHAPGPAGALESGSAILEERLLPVVEEGRLNLVLLADLRDQLLVDQMFAQDFYFVLR